MRLWHKDLISVLPRQQLIGQWRECCLIAKQIYEKGTPNHILVNKIMDYPLEDFFTYGYAVWQEMYRREYKADWGKFCRYFADAIYSGKMKEENVVGDYFKNWHNDRYLKQCYFNLQEKFDCDGIGLIEWEKIADFIEKYEWR